MRKLHQDPTTVARLRVASAGAPVGQIHQYLQALGHNVVRAFPINIHQETYSAGVMLVGGIIETIGL
jgi:hypothetical protein